MGLGAAEAAVQQIASSAVDSALRVVTTCDLQLLCEIMTGMELPDNSLSPTRGVVKDTATWVGSKADFFNPLPMNHWSSSVFTHANVAEIRDCADGIRAEVDSRARRTGAAAAAALAGGDKKGRQDEPLVLKDCHLEFHRALAGTLFSDLGEDTSGRYFQSFGGLLGHLGADSR
jgi:hypothetical protein